MKKLVFLIALSFACFLANAQRGFLGPSPMMTQAEENSQDMRRLVRRSCHLPFILTDSTEDTTLIKLVDSFHSRKDKYCVLFKDDTTKAAIEIKKLYPGYEVTAYWKSMGKKRVRHYTSRYVLTWTYIEYFENGKEKVIGNYENGKPDGKWKFYNAQGDETAIDQYNQGVLIIRKDK